MATALAPNVAPAANAGSDQATLSGVSVSLNGSCTDSDGTISDCNWGSAPAGCSFAGVQSKAGLGTANASSAVDVSCIGAVGAVFNFSLTATDNFGATGTDVMSVTISPVPLPTTLKITQFNAEPLSFPVPQPAPALPNEFSTVDVKVKNIGAGGSDVYVKLEVLSLQTGQSLGSVTESCAAVAPDSLCELGKDDFPGLDVSSLQSGACRLTATVSDNAAFAPVHDTKSLFWRLAGK